MTVLLLLSSSTGAATWSASVGQWETADMAEPAVGVERREITLAWEGQLLDQPHRISYTHRPVLIRTGRPAHNGYFHQLDLHTERPLGDTTLGVTVGLHGSSNMFRHGEFHRDAAVATFDLLYWPEDSGTGVGVFGDYRFGRFRLYPRLKLDLDAGRGSTLALDLPVTVRWRSAGQCWSAGIERVGDKWGALDAGRDTASEFYLSEWQLGIRRQWRQAWALTAGVSADTEVRYLDLLAGPQTHSLDPAAFLRLEFRTGD